MQTGLKKPFFLLLLPAFFFMHVLNENFNPILVKDAVKLILLYSLAALLLTGITWLFFRDITKAALFSFSVMAINFFFGLVHDGLKKMAPGSFITRYSFILPFLLIVMVVLVVYLKKSRHNFLRTTRYLNLLLLLLLLLDTAMVTGKLLQKKKQHVVDLSGSFTNCDTCSKPDVYLVITDEYAGKKELEAIFSFDNQAFETQLEERGFHMVKDPVSNYNATIYSMASILNMDYLSNLRSTRVNYRDMLTCSDLINHNNLVGFFKKNGYSVYNHSFFDMDNKNNPVKNYFYPSYGHLLSFQTLASRLNRDLGPYLASKERIERVKRNDMYSNATVDSLTRKLVLQKRTTPSFVYTHLNIPHHGYFYDSNGVMTPLEALTDEFTMDKKAYLGYLKYSNRKILELLDHIRKNSPHPPVIILLSDHGFRQFPKGSEEKYYFMNLNAVYLPDGNYTGFYDGMSNVNEFRVILNSQFHQKLPLLKDSTSFLVE